MLIEGTCYLGRPMSTFAKISNKENWHHCSKNDIFHWVFFCRFHHIHWRILYGTQWIIANIGKVFPQVELYEVDQYITKFLRLKDICKLVTNDNLETYQSTTFIWNHLFFIFAWSYSSATLIRSKFTDSKKGKRMIFMLKI